MPFYDIFSQESVFRTLSADNVNAEQEYVNNSYHYPSTTNLLTHGLHMAAYGRANRNMPALLSAS